jgi:hypothetical protein
MATDKQIEANRRNATKSTGPKTEAGKQASRTNAWKHGLAAKNMLYSPMRHEDHNAFLEMRNDLMKSWQPVGLKEEQLVDMIASAYNRMQRLEKIESGYMDGALATMQRRFGLPDTPTEADDFGCGVAMGDEKNQLTFETLDRYRKNAWLDYDRAVRRLEAMQKARRQQAIEEKEEELREAERQKKLAEIRENSTAKPVVYATEETTWEELASFRKNNPHVIVVPVNSDFRRNKKGQLTGEIVPITPNSDKLPA